MRVKLSPKEIFFRQIKMSSPQRPKLGVQELNEIDRLSYDRAEKILIEARKQLDALDYDLTVRRCQEAFELYLKGIFRFLDTSYPASHDLRKQIYTLTAALKGYQIDGRQIARLVLASSVLQIWRSPAFYGDETLGVGGLFGSEEAKLALLYTELGRVVCAIVRDRVYRQAVTYSGSK